MSSAVMVQLPGFPGLAIHRDALGGYHIENPRARRSRDRYAFATSLAEVAQLVQTMRR
jgi:hypothetical protein